MLSPESLEYAREKTEILLAQARRRQELESRQGSELQTRLAETDEKLRRFSDAIETVGVSNTLADRLKVLDKGRLQLQQAISALPEEDSVLPGDIPDFGARWRSLVADIANLRDRETPPLPARLYAIF